MRGIVRGSAFLEPFSMEVAQFRQGKEEVPALVDLGCLVEEADCRGRIVVRRRR